MRGLVLPILLHVAASIAKGVVPNRGSSCEHTKVGLETDHKKQTFVTVEDSRITKHCL